MGRAVSGSQRKQKKGKKPGDGVFFSHVFPLHLGKLRPAVPCTGGRAYVKAQRGGAAGLHSKWLHTALSAKTGTEKPARCGRPGRSCFTFRTVGEPCKALRLDRNLPRQAATKYEEVASRDGRVLICQDWGGGRRAWSTGDLACWSGHPRGLQGYR